MTDLPSPLVPIEVDLRDFVFMPLDVLRLRDSELAATPDAEVFRCAVLSWCVSWHQVPAASLPDDDVQLARLLGFGRDLKAWKRCRAAGGLRGWAACSDGRLYHAVVAEKAAEAWQGKLAQRWRTECARIKKHNQRHGLEMLVPDFEQWKSQGCPHGQTLLVPEDKHHVSLGQTQGQADVVPREKHSKGQGEGQGQGQGLEKEKRAARATPPPDRPDGVSEQVWLDWLALRRAKRAPVTQTVLDGAASEASKAGMPLDGFLRVWCRRGSQGLEASWLKPEERVNGAHPQGDVFAGAR